MAFTNTILYTVLNWGLGHASRSIPVVRNLIARGFDVHLASDGDALELLEKTFPALRVHVLPSLNISYSQSKQQQLAILKQTNELYRWYKADKDATKRLIQSNSYCGIISDNRPGVHSADIPSAYLTHQVLVQAGLATPIASYLHKKLYQDFNEIWIPDVAEKPGLAGALSHQHQFDNVQYIGPLSDLAALETKQSTFDIAIILSGPEPQRSLLEEKLIAQLGNSEQRILCIRGTSSQRPSPFPTSWTTHDLGDRDTIRRAFEESKLIISRNGYSTLMDLYHFQKPALLVPTPGQPEQEYLALLDSHQQKYAIQSQEKLDVQNGMEIALEKYGQQSNRPAIPAPNWDDLFSLFQGK